MLIHEPLTDRIIGAAMEVSNNSRAPLQELRSRGISAEHEVSFSVMYKGQYVGKYFADIVVERTVVVELKCVEHLTNEHVAQCLNYLHTSRMDLRLLMNF